MLKLLFGGAGVFISFISSKNVSFEGSEFEKSVMSDLAFL
jgi:hypothetical protein